MASVEIDNPESNVQVIPGIGYHDEYAMLEFDPNTRRVILWHPWSNRFQPKEPEGSTYGFVTEYGIFQLPLITSINISQRFI
jgi:hypothetical protein